MKILSGTRNTIKLYLSQRATFNWFFKNILALNDLEFFADQNFYFFFFDLQITMPGKFCLIPPDLSVLRLNR
jgi:hypothetical protein